MDGPALVASPTGNNPHTVPNDAARGSDDLEDFVLRLDEGDINRKDSNSENEDYKDACLLSELDSPKELKPEIDTLSEVSRVLPQEDSPKSPASSSALVCEDKHSDFPIIFPRIKSEKREEPTEIKVENREKQVKVKEEILEIHHESPNESLKNTITESNSLGNAVIKEDLDIHEETENSNEFGEIFESLDKELDTLLKSPGTSSHRNEIQHEVDNENISLQKEVENENISLQKEIENENASVQSEVESTNISLQEEIYNENTSLKNDDKKENTGLIKGLDENTSLKRGVENENSGSKNEVENGSASLKTKDEKENTISPVKIEKENASSTNEAENRRAIVQKEIVNENTSLKKEIVNENTSLEKEIVNENTSLKKEIENESTSLQNEIENENISLRKEDTNIEEMDIVQNKDKLPDTNDTNSKKPLINGKKCDEESGLQKKGDALEGMDDDDYFDGMESESMNSDEDSNSSDISLQSNSSDSVLSEGACIRIGKKKRTAENEFPKEAKKIKISHDSKVPNGITPGKKLVNGFGPKEGSKSSGDVLIEDESLQSPLKKKKKNMYDNSCVINKDKSAAKSEIYKEARDKLFASPFMDSRLLMVDGNMLEELVMMKVVEYLTIGAQNEKRPPDNAALLKKCRTLENKLQQMYKRAYDLTKQVEDCKHIIKKLIEEKATGQSWTNNVMPLRVTRSVGLQVCTVGSVNVTSSRSKDLESVKHLLNSNKNTQDSQDVNKNRDKDELVFVGEKRKEGENKESVKTEPKINQTSGEKRIQETDRLQVTSSAPSSILPSPRNGITAKSLHDSSTGKTDGLGRTAEKLPPPKVSACIDLTDNDDLPSKPPPPSLKAPMAAVSVKPPSALYPPEKLNGGPSKPQEMVHVPKLAKKSAGPNKKLNILPVANDLITTEELPKFPPAPKYPADITRPPKPILRIGRNNSGKQGIMLSWNFESGKTPQDIEEYQLYAFQENKVPDKNKDIWKKVGDIKALPLPMACFLTQFVEGHKYHFIVRAMDKEKVFGEFSSPGSIILQPTNAGTVAPNQPPNSTTNTTTSSSLKT